MLIPKIVAALLAARQLDQALPSSYCAPECPSCRTEVVAFDNSTACVVNSSFIRDCSACQQCVLTYNVNNGRTPAALQLESNMEDILNLCQNTTVAAHVQEVQADTSRTLALPSATISPSSTTAPTPAITSPPTLTTGGWGGRDRNYSDGSWTTKCAVEPVPSWCSRRSSRLSASIAAALANATANASPSAPPQPTQSPQPVNISWIAGPIIGSIMGLATVLIVILFTRRKHALLLLQAQQALPSRTSSTSKKSFDADSLSSESQPIEKAQLHSDCVEPKELEACEVAELPALEPVGVEMLTPKSGRGMEEEDWPLPISPLPALFAESEIRDKRRGVDVEGSDGEEKRHETFYHP